MTGKVLTRPGKSKTTFESGDAYIERIEAAVAIFRSKNLDPIRPIPDQMNEAANKGTGRVRNPVYHYVISWEKKSVTHKEAHKAVAKTVEALGARGWQWVGALHGDTDNPHAHVIINRIHPETGLAWIPSHDYYKLSKVCNEIEPPIKTRKATDLPSPRAADYEVYTGQKSLQTWIRQEVVPQVAEHVLTSQSRSWSKLHEVLGQNGTTYEKDGKLTDHTGKKDVSTTATSVSSFIALPYLEQSLGPYEPRDTTIKISETGYGSLRENHKLPTERMTKPDIAPIYKAWVNERQDWESGGRERSRQVRIDIKNETKHRRKRLTTELQEAQKILVDSVPELAPELLNIINDIANKRKSEIEQEQKEALTSISEQRPHELFRKWLKERAMSGDTSATEAIRSLRQGEDMNGIQSPPLYAVTGLTEDKLNLLISMTAKSAKRWADARENEEQNNRLAVEASRYAPSKITSYTKETKTVAEQANLLRSKMDQDSRKASEFIETMILHEIKKADPQLGNDVFVKQHALAASTLPYAVKLERTGYDARDACRLFALTSIEDQEMASLGKRFEQTKSHSDYLKHIAERESIKHQATQDSAYPLTVMQHSQKPFYPHWLDGKPLFDTLSMNKTTENIQSNPKPEIETQSETIENINAEEQEVIEERELLNEEQAVRTASEPGTIGPSNRTTKQEEETSNDSILEAQYRQRYEMYMDTLGTVGFGPQGQNQQREIHLHRLRDLETSKKNVLKEIPKKHTIAQTLAYADIAAQRQDLNRRAVLENNVIHNMTGALTPPSFREYLEMLDEQEATRLAKKMHKTDGLSPVSHLDFEPQIMKKLSRSTDKGNVLFSINDKVKFISDGELIHLDSSKDTEANMAALLVAKEQYGVPLSLEGNKTFKMRMLRHAVELGIEVSNDELKQMQADLIEEKNKNKIIKDNARIGGIYEKDFNKVINNKKMESGARLQALDEITMRSVITTVKDQYQVAIKEANQGDTGTLREVVVLGRLGYAVIEKEDGSCVCSAVTSGMAKDLDYVRSDKGNKVTIGAADERTKLLDFEVTRIHGMTSEEYLKTLEEAEQKKASENTKKANGKTYAKKERTPEAAYSR